MKPKRSNWIFDGPARTHAIVIYQSYCLESAYLTKQHKFLVGSGIFTTYRRQHCHGYIGFSKAINDFGSFDQPIENVRPNSWFRHGEVETRISTLYVPRFPSRYNLLSKKGDGASHI